MYKGNIGEFLENLGLYLKKEYPEMVFKYGYKELLFKNKSAYIPPTNNCWCLFLSRNESPVTWKDGWYSVEEASVKAVTDSEDFEEQVYEFINKRLKYYKNEC